MIGKIHRRTLEGAGDRMAAPIRAAIVRLAEACNYARETHSDLWDFAVEIDALKAAGVSFDELRWLVANGYARHAREVTRQSDAVRNFLPASDGNFHKNTCFIITDAGLRLTATEITDATLKRAA
jgi:hypothetical protein